jgi:hypothetical protein
VLALVACSGSSTNSPDASPDAGGAASCAEYAEVTCARRLECAAGAFALEWGTAERCEAAAQEDCESRRDAVGSGLTAAVIAECATELESASCVVVKDYELARCLARGSLADETACLYDEQCAGGNCYRVLNSNWCGVCKTLGDVGDECALDPDDGLSCAPGLICTVAGVCEEGGPALEGESCAPETLRRCATSFRCGAGYVCVPLLPADAACEDLFDCDIHQGLFCDPEVDRCRPLPVSTDGACLPIGAPGGAICPVGQYCDGTFQCQTFQIEGGECDDYRQEPRCESGYACAATATCVAVAELTCAGGDVDPGDETPNNDPFVFDIPDGASVVLDCAASTATATYVGRYANDTGVPAEARVVSAVVTLGGAVALDLAVTPISSGPVGETAVGVTHTGTLSPLPAGACDHCDDGEATLEVVVDFDGFGLSFSTVATLACSLDRAAP